MCLPLLVWQFAGPRSYTDIEHNARSFNSPLALLSFAEPSWLAGDAETANALAFNTTEQNAF